MDRFRLLRFRARQRGALRGFREAIGERPRMRLAVLATLLATLSAAILLVTPPAVAGYEVGQVATQIVRAPRSVTFVSDTLTGEARDRAAEAVPRLYRRDPSVPTQKVDALTQSLARIVQARAGTLASRESRLAAVQGEVGAEVAPDALDMPIEEWNALAKDLPEILRSILAQEIRTEEVEQVRADAPKSLPAAWTPRQRRVASELLQRSIASNTTFDAQATERAQAEARANTPAVVVQVLANEVIAREGQQVTPAVVEKLRAEGLSSAGIDWKSALGLILWAALVATMYAFYLDRFQPEVWRDARRVVVSGGALLVALAASRALIPGHALLVYFVPYAAVAMTLAILVGGRTAAVTQVAAALHVGMMSGQVELFAYALLPALLGMSALRRGTTARDFLRATAFTAVGDLGVLASFLLAAKSPDILGALQVLGAGAANAILSGLLAFAGIVAIGHLARITTVFELRELGDPNHPLLRQLLLRTPGTYHHSLLVANLAERAAEMVGADPLVARVGAYYHDIGKMRNPTAFIENQAGEKNPHDELDPLVSAQIVAAHARDGLALGERYGLPGGIKEMISGHHGTALVKFFYQKAQARGEVQDVDAYRYPGPKSRSREAGIVALADGVEASVRSLPEKTQDEIRRMVDKIVTERVEEGQLDECELTLADIQKIKAAFVELLVSVYHERIPYPEDRITQLPPRATRAH